MFLLSVQMIVRLAIPMSVSELSTGCVRNAVQGKSNDRVAASLPLVPRYCYDIIICIIIQ